MSYLGFAFPPEAHFYLPLSGLSGHGDAAHPLVYEDTEILVEIFGESLANDSDFIDSLAGGQGNCIYLLLIRDRQIPASGKHKTEDFRRGSGDPL